ncbi:MAG TPA: glycosyltransferase family 1 protein [Sphingobium sp.]|nr:glycosyltransferase family 1 protein [Sphingobium sp.]
MSFLPFPTIQSRSASRRPLRVALFSGNYDCVRDGANQALNRLVAHLLEVQGAQVRIYSPRAPQPAFPSVGDVRAVRSLSLPGRPEYRLALGFTRATRADFDAFEPDLVHLSAPDLLGRQAQKHARACGIPVIASLHTRFETYADYYRIGFLRRTIEAYLDRFYDDCDHILAPTRPIADDLARKHGAGRVSVWGRGVDRALFHPGLRDETLRAANGYTPDTLVPLFFGRLVLEKGLDIFADAMAALRAGGHPVRPLIVGEGPARNWLEKRLPDALFTGHLEGADLGRAIASADILINPSVTEAFGNVNLEAMASGLAVVSADVASASALIDHGHNGLLVTPKDVDAFAGAAHMLMADPARRRTLGLMASATAARYRWDDVLAGVFETYRHCTQHAAVSHAA